MPFDGTGLDQVTQDLIKAKELLIQDGWCIGTTLDGVGRRCTIGAIYKIVFGSEYGHTLAEAPRAKPHIERLAANIPTKSTYSRISEAYDICVYNNKQKSIEPILEWFDRAIAAR